MGGYGPRDGWLVFFAESCSDNSAGLVRHVTGRVTPRTPPEGALPAPHFAEEKAIAALRDLAGETVTALPCWYLEAVPDSTSDYTHPDVMEALDRADWRAPLEAIRALPPEDRLPFDVVTARGWLTALEGGLIAYLDQRRKPCRTQRASACKAPLSVCWRICGYWQAAPTCPQPKAALR